MKGLVCWMYGHEYHILKVFTHYSRKIGCYRCKSVWTMNDDVRCLLPWDNEFEQLHEIIDKRLK